VIDYGAYSEPGPRPYNEDAQLIRDLSPFSERLGGLLVFMVVSDGMGGHQSGDVASRIAVETAASVIDRLCEDAGRTVDTIDPERVLAQIAVEADAAVVHEAQERGGVSMGATYVAALATADRAWIAHIGDSRAYLVRGGAPVQLTIDHSQVGRMIADGVLTEEQAQHHPQRNVIERALGFGDGRGPDTKVVDLQRDDVLLLCTDGMSTVLTGKDIADIVSTSADLRLAAKALVEEAIRLGSDDNTTVALWSGSRAPRTITDRVMKTDAARSRSREKRAAQRHSRATRASYYVAGVLGAVLLIGVALVTLGGGATSGGGKVDPVGGRSAAPTSTPRPSGARGTGSSSAVPTMPVVYAVKDSRYGKAVIRSGPSQTFPPLTGKIAVGIKIRLKSFKIEGDYYPVFLGPEDAGLPWLANNRQLLLGGSIPVGWVRSSCVTVTPPFAGQ
jgi:PPM family protein phosphatase